MVVKDFSKGINLVKAPDKLDPSFAVKLENADTFGGDIKSTKHPGDVKTSLHEPYFYQPKGLTEGFSIFTASRASYWAFKNGVAYQADGINKPQKWYNRGLVGAGAVGAVALSPGNYDHTNLEHRNLGIERPRLLNDPKLNITQNFAVPPRADSNFEPFWQVNGLLNRTYTSSQDSFYPVLYSRTAEASFNSGIPNQTSYIIALIQYFYLNGTKYVTGITKKTVSGIPLAFNNVNTKIGIKLGAKVTSDLLYDIYIQYTLPNNVLKWHKLYSGVSKTSFAQSTGTNIEVTFLWRVYSTYNDHIWGYRRHIFVYSKTKPSISIILPEHPGMRSQDYTQGYFVKEGTSTYARFQTDNQEVINPTANFLSSVREDNLPTLSNIQNITDDDKVKYQLFVTYYDEEFGVESRQSDITETFLLYPNWVSTISNLPISQDPQVTHKKVYAIDYSTGATKLLGETLNANTTLSVFLGGVFDNVFTGENNEPAPKALLYITQNFGILFGSVGNELRWCIPGHYDYWPPSNSISFEKPITGILPFNQGLLVFTEDETWGVLGSSVENFTKVPISFDQGCINHDTCKFIKSLPIWMSKEGLCTFYSGQVQVLSRGLLGSTHIYTTSCALYNERYFILGLNEIWEFDFRMGIENLSIKHHSIPTGITPLQLGVIDDNLVYSYTDSSNNHWYKELISDRGTENTLVYKSPIFTEGSFSTLKQLNEINFKLEGTFSIVVTQYHESGTFAQTQAVTPTDKFYKFKLDSQNQNFLGFDVEITGTGVISEFGYNPIPNQLVERVPPRV